MSLVSMIQTLCNDKDTTLIGLEREVGLGRGTIRNWDTNSPSMDKVQKVADYFHVSVDYLLGREIESKADIRRIERARNQMSSEQQERMMKILELSFEEYFKDDDFE